MSLRRLAATRRGPRLHIQLWILGLLSFFELRDAMANGAPAAARAGATIRLNTVGYRPGSVKQATVATDAEVFVVREAQNGNEVLRGELLRIDGDEDDANLRIADFSKVDREGAYRLEIEGRDTAEFRIARDVYNWPFYCSVRAMYLWRCGTAVSADLHGDHFHYDACHLDDGYLEHAGDGGGEHKDATGGWHDAGDYNKYAVNGAFTAGMMLQAWEHFQDKLVSIKLDIPESDNDIPDFLDEVRWEIDWLLKMQADDGRVYHKLSTIKFGGFVLPEQETERRYFSPWSSAATADFVAVVAQAARVIQPYDEEYSSRCLAAATKSYEFLQAHPEDHRPDLSAFSTGPYNAPDPDDRLWAAAEMWETTGDDRYLEDLERRIALRKESRRNNRSVVDPDWDWVNVGNLGLFTYLLSKRSGRDVANLQDIRQDALRAANGIVETAQRHPYGRPLGSTHYWGCNGTVARQAINLHVASRLTGEKRYVAAMLDSLNHLFGRNPFGRSYVTGLGADPPLFPHDRRSGGDKVAAPWPGYLIGGPWPKADDWYDVEEDYRTNEVAINWNGALIYALAAFVEPEDFDSSISTANRANRTIPSSSSATQ